MMDGRAACNIIVMLEVYFRESVTYEMYRFLQPLIRDGKFSFQWNSIQCCDHHPHFNEHELIKMKLVFFCFVLFNLTFHTFQKIWKKQVFVSFCLDLFRMGCRSLIYMLVSLNPLVFHPKFVHFWHSISNSS